MRQVLVNKDGVIINAIEIEDGSSWQPPTDCRLLGESQSNKADINDKVVGTQLIKHSYTGRDGNIVIPAPITLN